jgi:serine/threonine-protein kinase
MPEPASPRSTADHNLLLGVLALQMELITRDGLTDAVKAWVLDKAKTLGDVLVSRGHLSPGELSALKTLALSHVGRHGDDPAKSLAAATTRALLPRVLEQIADPDLRASLPHVWTARADGDEACAAAAPTVGSPTSSGLRFRVLRPHAKGGLGQVSVALDAELGRHVALKEIQEHFADDPDCRARFLWEAEVTGHLEHPGVVPVYGLGRYSDGRPFYAMRFIRGDTFQDAIQRFHAADVPGRDPGERALALRQLLRRFLDVCNAVAYAHARGVLHRDLKPANVMLGPYGETLVVDWGLAKPVDRPEGLTGGEEDALRPTQATGLAPTQAGTVVGTPQYMSPEQAAGGRVQLGPAGDVYSLGATLYCLLTGRAPVEDSEVLAALLRVQSGDFPPPRRVKPGVPAALEAVCVRAMALQPERRYGSPKELADDIDRWLAEEPVRAYREPLRVRAGRWVRRHQTAVAAAAAALVVAAAFFGVATGLLTAAYQEAERQRDVAAAQRDKARDRFRLAREAVDRFYTQVSESTDLRARGLEGLRQTLLESAAAFYRRFVQEESDDAEVRAEQGRAYLRLANLYRVLRRGAQAERAYRQAVATAERLTTAFPGETRYQEDLALAHNALGVLYRDTGRLESAERSFQAARAVRRRLVDQAPHEPKHREDLAVSEANLGAMHSAVGRLREAERAYRRAEGLFRQLADARPQEPHYQRYLATVYNNLGALYAEQMDRPDPAEQAHREALRLRRRLAAEHPREPQYQEDLAGSHNKLGSLYSDTGRNGLAERAHREAERVARSLAEAHPRVPGYRKLLADTLMNLAIVYGETGHLDRCERTHRRAVDIQAALARAHPGFPEYALDLGSSYVNLGNLMRGRGRLAEACDWYTRAVERLAAFLRTQPQDADTRESLIGAHGGRAAALSRLGRSAEAAEDWKRVGELEPKGAGGTGRLFRAEFWMGARDHARAVAEAKAAAQGKAVPGSSCYGLAGVYARAVSAVRRDGKLTAEKRERLGSQYGAAAVALLKRARAAGYFGSRQSAEALKKDADWVALHSCEDFKGLVAEVDKALKARPK